LTAGRRGADELETQLVFVNVSGGGNYDHGLYITDQKKMTAYKESTVWGGVFSGKCEVQYTVEAQVFAGSIFLISLPCSTPRSWLPMCFLPKISHTPR
jgi:hypothetical protein